MVGDLELAGEVLRARDLIGEYRRQQILRRHARERRRHLAAAAETRQRERGRRGLQLEVERAAEALAQRQPPGAVHPAAEGRVDDELHAARLVEEALEN